MKTGYKHLIQDNVSEKMIVERLLKIQLIFIDFYNFLL